MADWSDVRDICSELPDTVEDPERVWKVQGKAFVHERPLRTADLAHLGAAAPDDTPMGVHVPDLGAKEALLASATGAYFTTPHVDGDAMVLARLDVVPLDELREIVLDAWLARAPRRLAAAWLAEHD